MIGPDEKGHVRFEVQDLSPTTMRLLSKEENLDYWLHGRVIVNGAAGDRMLGKVYLKDDRLVLAPRFPLEAGLTYEITLEPNFATVERFSIPKRKQTNPTLVRQVYPSADALPENLLKFYVQFSGPMSRGEAYQRVKLLNGDGTPIELPFLELGEELWNATNTRLTLLFDPGRIKQGVTPREEVGPVLEAGKTYTLVVEPGWTDADGIALNEGFQKQFSAIEPDHVQPSLEKWQIEAPAAGDKAPLTITFEEPLDYAMLQHVLQVQNAMGQEILGQVAVDEQETRWRFTPDEPWQPGSYQIIVETNLEDRAGNSIAKPFEIDVFEKVEPIVDVETKTIPFEITAPATP